MNHRLRGCHSGADCDRERQHQLQRHQRRALRDGRCPGATARLGRCHRAQELGLGFGLGLGAPGLWWGLSAGLTATAAALVGRFLWLTGRPIARVEAAPPP